MLWYLCQAPFSCSAVGASPSQPLQVGLMIFPLGLVSLLHITVLYRHCTFTGVLSDLHQYSEKSQPLSMAQYFLVSWIHRQAAAGKGDMLSSYLFAVRPVFPLRGGKQLHSRCQQECSRKCSLSDTQSAASSCRCWWSWSARTAAPAGCWLPWPKEAASPTAGTPLPWGEGENHSLY